MNKMKMQTSDIADENFRKLAALFPDAVTETVNADGEVVRAIDKDMLMQDISATVVEGNEERYQFTWPDKRKAIRLASSPIAATLRPCREESVNFDTTENLYIEGDNLDVLKLLRETYLGKVKMIYIDPPYNTGNDFVYEDDFSESAEDYAGRSGNYDDQGNRMVQNTDSNGRFHTDWLNMIYPRLKVAKDLLAEDGVIFISIDDNEVAQLRKVCDEIFCTNNFISEIIVKNNPRGRQSDAFFATVHEYLLCYARNSASCKINGEPLTAEQQADYTLQDENGKYRLLGLRQRGVASLREDRPDMYFPIYVNPSTFEISLTMQDGWKEVLPRKSDGRAGRWMWGRQKCHNDETRLVAKLIKKRNEFDIFVKDYLASSGEERTRKAQTLWDTKDINNQVGTQEVKALLEGGIMSFPKSRPYIEKICTVGASKNSIILDFFSGSATTAHAVMQLNAEDGGKRKFIMVQLPEACPEDGEAFKTGYKNICEIGKERIRRAGKKITTECTENTEIENDNNKASSPSLFGEAESSSVPSVLSVVPDVGFRVLKLDSTNMEDVYYNPAETKQDDLLSRISNIKPDRTPEDLLFQVMLELGILPSSKIEKSTIAGKQVFRVADDFLIACIEENITDEVVTAIAKQKPTYVVVRDSTFATDSVAANFEQIFATYSPDTTRRIL